MESKTKGEIKAEACDSLREFKGKALTREDIATIQKRVNELLQNWLDSDILLHHAGLPVGSVVITATYSSDDIASNIKISLQPL